MTTQIARPKSQNRPSASAKARTRRALFLAGAGLAACLGAGWAGVALWGGSDERPNKSEAAARATEKPRDDPRAPKQGDVQRPETPNRAATEPARPAASAEVSDEAKPIAPADFAKLQEMIKPRSGEANWAEIPWMTNLWEARKKAAKEGKPLFIWSASADAQGCT